MIDEIKYRTGRFPTYRHASCIKTYCCLHLSCCPLAALPASSQTLEIENLFLHSVHTISIARLSHGRLTVPSTSTCNSSGVSVRGYPLFRPDIHPYSIIPNLRETQTRTSSCVTRNYCVNSIIMVHVSLSCAWSRCRYASSCVSQ